MNGNYLITGGKPEVKGDFELSYKHVSTEIVTVKDSYDYLLAGKGYCLLQKQGGEIILFSAGGLKEYLNIDSTELKTVVDAVVLPRVLLSKHKVKVGIYQSALKDDLEKTIAKGEFYSLEIGEHKVCAISLEPLRGYNKEVKKGISQLRGDFGSFGDALKRLIVETGDELINYSAKPVINLSPEQPMYEVMKGIYSHLIYVMSMNTKGIIDDVDIEFLHDFRVSVRRTRSALSLIRGVYSKDIEKEFRGRFRDLGSMTGTARDMDVYLDMLGDYEAMLPEWLKGGMDELSEHFIKTRTAEYRKLAAYLKSVEFDKLHDDWTEIISTDKYASKKGKKPVLHIAKKAIYEAFTEIEKQAEGMNKDTHSDAVHEIRISFKKIRYLLEFYSSLFDKQKIAPMLKDMKVLQDSLGDHNDYYVQQLSLEELIESREWSSITASACGFLTAILAEKQSAERERSLKLIISFMNYKPLFGELFK